MYLKMKAIFLYLTAALTFALADNSTIEKSMKFRDLCDAIVEQKVVKSQIKNNDILALFEKNEIETVRTKLVMEITNRSLYASKENLIKMSDSDLDNSLSLYFAVSKDISVLYLYTQLLQKEPPFYIGYILLNAEFEEDIENKYLHYVNYLIISDVLTGISTFGEKRRVHQLFETFNKKGYWRNKSSAFNHSSLILSIIVNSIYKDKYMFDERKKNLDVELKLLSKSELTQIRKTTKEIIKDLKENFLK